MNATNLFLLPQDGFHNSESAWSSLLAFQILDASRQGVRLRIPTFVYREDADRWCFEEQNKPLELPSQLGMSSIIVEGKLRTGFHSKASNPLPNRFNDLRPDIAILGDSSFVVIEAKTVGARITSKERLYFELCEWLVDQGINAAGYLLISAGHQPDSDIRGLVSPEWKQPPRLLLWEQLFKAIENQVPNSLLSRLIPDLQDYYKCEEAYLDSSFVEK